MISAVSTCSAPTPTEVLLGWLLAAGDPARVLELLVVEDIDARDPDLVQIASALFKLAQRGEPIGSVTCRAALGARADSMRLGARLGELMDAADASVDVVNCACMVRRDALRRRERLLAVRLSGGLDDDQAAATRDEMASMAIELAGEGDPNGWPVLLPLDAAVELPRLPANVLPGWAGAYAAALSEATETPAELAIAMALGVCGSAVARRWQVRVRGDHTEPCALWIVCALPPGSRKSAVQAAAVEPVVAWERDQATAMRETIARAKSERETLVARAKALRGRAASRGDLEAAREAADIEAALPEVPAAPRIWTADATPERIGMLLAEQGEAIAIFSAEGGMYDTLAGRYADGVANLDLVLGAWSGDPHRVDRVGRESIYLRRPRLTMALAPQPDVIYAAVRNPLFRRRGLAGRTIYLVPPSGIGRRQLEAPSVPAHVLADYAFGLRRLLDVKPARDVDGREALHTIHLAPDAYSDWLTAARAIEVMLREDGRLGEMTDWGSKLAGTAARIAGILHCIEHADARPEAIEIGAATMERALGIATVAIEHAIRVYEAAGADPALEAAASVWRAIERQREPRPTVRDVYRAARSLARAEGIDGVDGALRELERRGYVRRLQVARSGRGRPASPTVVVRPDIVATWSREG